jgi:hypothetical protein
METPLANIHTFHEAGALTNNKGSVVRIGERRVPRFTIVMR